MTRTVGIDPGTVSFDLCGLEDGQVFLDQTLPSKEFAKDPQILMDLLQSVQPLDLISAPSGYGLPLVPIEKFGDHEKFLFTLVDERERDHISVLGGMGTLIRLMKTSRLPVLFIPGVIHLPTVPEHRKANRVDMGTADKLCCLALAIHNQAQREQIPYDQTAFILVEVGGAFTAVMAVDGGQVVDGIGGSVGAPGYFSMGGMDGELAYLLSGFHKEVLFTGGAAYIAGRPELPPEEFADLAAQDPRARLAWDALLEGICKSVAAELAILPHPREILISGRLCRTPKFRSALIEQLSRFGHPVRRVEGFAKVAKEAAQGAALIADGLAGGMYCELVERMAIQKARGTIFDHIYVKDTDALRRKYLK